MVQALGLRQGQAVWRRLGLLSHTRSKRLERGADGGRCVGCV